jgi:hypothetical protein
MKKFIQIEFWKKGGGEIIGFAYILPFIVMLICCLIAAAQVSITNQRLSYTAYSSCRSAVVSIDENTARDRGYAIYESIMGDPNANSGGVTYVPFEMTVLDGNQWIKGSFVKCTVRVYVKTLLPFTSGVREESIIMMIESNAPGAFEYIPGTN